MFFGSVCGAKAPDADDPAARLSNAHGVKLPEVLLVELLVGAGAHVDAAVDKEGRSPLYLAAYNRLPEVVERPRQAVADETLVERLQQGAGERRWVQRLVRGARGARRHRGRSKCPGSGLAWHARPESEVHGHHLINRAVRERPARAENRSPMFAPQGEAGHRDG